MAGAGTGGPGGAELASCAMEQALTHARKGHYCTENPKKRKRCCTYVSGDPNGGFEEDSQSKHWKSNLLS